MDWYFYIEIIAVVLQILFLFLAVHNYRYAMSRYKRKRQWYRPKTALIVPCKGIDTNFGKNIASFYNQQYEDYVLYFVVEDKTDPAYEQLCKIKEKFFADSQAKEVFILEAGKSQTCSQKLYNLLHCYGQLGEDIEAMAFADSDACIQPNWLSHIVYPIRRPKCGASSGYRWFIPEKSNLATIALAALNAKVTQLMGNTGFNQAWGGSMAIKVDVFEELGIDKIWTNALSDDLSLSYAVKKAHKKVTFVPACLVASYENTSWAKLWEFGRRQFLITRVSSPCTWLFGLVSSFFAVLGLWGGLWMSIYAFENNLSGKWFSVIVPVSFFIFPAIRAIMRQLAAVRLLSNEDKTKMKATIIADVGFFWVWHILMLLIIVSSAFGRTIVWRSIKYKLLGPTETIIIDQK
ncbi:MAG: glycosyltransferase family 2 protein [Planctomycetes bacterium]|nr:glycosyltransferase family 2 protein [Planctomycetota bacterium]